MRAQVETKQPHIRIKDITSPISRLTKTWADLPTAARVGLAATATFGVIALHDYVGNNIAPNELDRKPAEQGQTIFLESVQRLVTNPALKEWRNGLPDSYTVTIGPSDPFLFKRGALDPIEPTGVAIRDLPSTDAPLADPAFFVQEGRFLYGDSVILINDEKGKITGVFLTVSHIERPKDFQAPPGSESEIIRLETPKFADHSVLEFKGFTDKSFQEVAQFEPVELTSPNVNWPRTSK